MKYIIFKQKDLLIPIIFDEHITHSQIKIEGAKPVSAGFVYRGLGSIRVSDRKSESLNLGPHTADLRFLERAQLELGTNAFIDTDNLYK
jgi:hypothetical protein